MLTYNKFDSKVLGKYVGEVDINREPLIEDDLLSYDYVVAKVPSGRIDIIRELEDSGFRICSTLLTFKHKNVSCHPSPDIIIRPAIESDLPDLLTIGRASFYLDRYHTDPYLTKEDADKLYDAWIENAVLGVREEVVFVALYQGEILGFTVCRINKGIGIIDLTAVSLSAFLKYKISYLAYHLILHAVSFFYSRHVHSIETATQSTNKSSINSLLMSFFEIDNSYIILSWRNPK